MGHYLTAKEAAAELGLSEHAVRDCVSAGAPVYRWGAAGRQYRIVLDEFVRWMHEHGKAEHEKRQQPRPANVIDLSAAQMEQRRHDLVRSLGGVTA